MSYANGITNQQQLLNSISAPSTPQTLQPAVSANPVSDGAVSSSPGPEHADLTSLSATGGLVSQSLEGSDVRTEKVASLQQAIAAGSYSVSSSDVAGKIIQSLLE
jgi:negative regulator of flagellin synthesis FlgM